MHLDSQQYLIKLEMTALEVGQLSAQPLFDPSCGAFSLAAQVSDPSTHIPDL